MFSVAQWNLCDILQQIIQQTKPRGKFSLSEQSFEMKPFNKPCHTLLSGQPQTLYSTDCILKDVSLDTCKKRCLDQEYPIHDCISAIANNKQNNECNYLQVEKKDDGLWCFLWPLCELNHNEMAENTALWYKTPKREIKYGCNRELSDVCPSHIGAIDMYPKEACIVNDTDKDKCKERCTNNDWPEHCRTNLECKFLQVRPSFSDTCVMSTSNCEPVMEKDLQQSLTELCIKIETISVE
ncbi:uncharacterized protein LOC142355580, partial [Convolutriloba macropyga]|uniref:uncharacterized protein LOC142355580 n=1 Tax=Convolutriloba macropyga TaxID=536237 RepID=UPI003F52030D